MKALALVLLCVSLVAPATVHAQPDAGVPTPCDPMLLDWLCTVWQAVWRLAYRVCSATWVGCPELYGSALP